MESGRGYAEVVDQKRGEVWGCGEWDDNADRGNGSAEEVSDAGALDGGAGDVMMCVSFVMIVAW